MSDHYLVLESPLSDKEVTKLHAFSSRVQNQIVSQHYSAWAVTIGLGEITFSFVKIIPIPSEINSPTQPNRNISHKNCRKVVS